MSRLLQLDAPNAAGPRPLTSAPSLAKINLLLLAGFFVALVALLWPHWRDNADLSHGFVTPVLFLLLLHEARRGPQRYLRCTAGLRAVQSTLLALALLLVCASGLYAATLDWTHSLVAFVLTGAFVLLLGASLLGFAADSARIIPFNWTAVVAIAVWLLSAPIPPGTYLRLMLALQLTVTENVLRALHLLGIAAQRHGNVIELATATVGVEEACSGIRSLISCIFAGLFFSATLVRRPWARALIIALAAPLAIAMNFLRSLILTLLANHGADISGLWHDLTGFAVLGVTAGLLAAIALALERRSPPAATPTATTEAATGYVRPAGYRSSLEKLQLPVTVAGAITVALALFFVVNTRPSARQNLPPPDLLAVLPGESGGWNVQTADDLYQFTATLQTEHLAQRTYTRVRNDQLEQITVYLAYWPAGQAPVSLVASHTPDACWPGSGWVPVPLAPAATLISLPGRPLAQPEARLFLSGQRPQYVWFWHLYDGRPIAHREPRSPLALLKLASKYGFSHNGDQLFVRVSSNRPWPEFSGEPLIAQLFERLQPFGL
ncbi:exosortase/archaeosortase family protein [Opitutus terrae]|uniref:Methanolan biosynthesis EpsI domain-containing protein n=1 Tax=Opitutus terrae (strain DSM 11246 / JCM 15787 / PB90-1) TaxID=452637 RepID=B1ZZ87_OPITP|nr:exosortase/archaeosortase family protein [Opitutus terrae]ACB77159.1 hypothetical protein Oter_3885 [Opitutus terrae PB90-1]